MSETPPMNSPINAPKVLLGANTGCGKSTSIKTLAKAGVECFVLATENNALEILNPVKGVRIHSLMKSIGTWQSQRAVAENVNRYDQDVLMKLSDPGKPLATHFLTLLEQLNNFKDDKTGKEYGDVSTWGTGRALILDGLTGTNSFAKRLVVGGRPILQQADWQIGQNIIYPLIEALTAQTRCWVVVTCHLEIERDEVLGTTKIMPSTLGRKLAPTLPPLFTAVIRPMRLGEQFSWSTADA